MRILNRLFMILCLLSTGAKGDERSEWFSERRSWIEQAKTNPNAVELSKLGRIVTGVGPNLGKASPEAKELFYEARALLLSTPGFAEYHRDRINEERAKLDKLDREQNISMWTYQRAQWQNAKVGFAVMAYLPSVETMRVLGGFIRDERGKLTLPENPTYSEQVRWHDSWPNAYSAVFTLKTLPLVAKPIQLPDVALKPADIDEAVKTWRQWFDEVEAGKRTFRFEGDPTEYDLDGPAPKEKLERIAMHQRREGGRASRHAPAVAQAGAAEQSPAASPAQRNVAYAMIAAGIAVMASMVWYFRTARRKGRQ